MKQQKWSFLASIFTLLVSLGIYLAVTFYCFDGNEIVKDISMAIFSSAFFVVILSFIGYIVEKRRLLDKIYERNTHYGLETYFGLAENYNQITIQALSILLLTLKNNLEYMDHLLVEYYEGIFFKDKQMKAAIADKFVNLYEYVKNLYLESISPQCDVNKIENGFDEMLKAYEPFTKSVDDWLCKKIENLN